MMESGIEVGIGTIIINASKRRALRVFVVIGWLPLAGLERNGFKARSNTVEAILPKFRDPENAPGRYRRNTI